jgi:hypothetical protein
MRERILNWSVGLIFLAGVMFVLSAVMHAEQDARRKCTKAGLVFVQPHRGEAYCAVGKTISALD